MNRGYGIEKMLIAFALMLMIVITVISCWYLTENVPLTVIVGIIVAFFLNIFQDYIKLFIFENREKDRINKENKDNYKKYKKKHPKPVEWFKTHIKAIKKEREVTIEFGKDYGDRELIYYNFAQKSDIENNFIVKDIFIELLEEDLGRVDRY